MNSGVWVSILRMIRDVEKRTWGVVLLFMVFFFLYLYPLVLLSWHSMVLGVEAYSNHVQVLADEHSIQNINLNEIIHLLSALIAGAGFGYFLSNTSAKSHQKLSATATILVVVLVGCVAAVLVHFHLLANAPTIDEMYGDNAVTALTEITASRFRESLGLTAVLLGFSTTNWFGGERET